LQELNKTKIDVVLNNIHPLMKNFTVIKEAIGDNKNISLMTSTVKNRKIYKDTLGFGKSVFDTNDKTAIKEIKEFCNELISD
jgi:chromosome partitioning protein